MATPPSAVFEPSPVLRRFEHVCVHIAYKGAMNRQAYAFYAPGSPSSGRPRPDPPLFSRHVEFLSSIDDLARVRTWWKDSDVNRTVGKWFPYTTSASDLKHARNVAARWIPNASWFLDFSHGGTPNLWRNICHWSNSMFLFFEAAHLGRACARDLANVFMWQVGASEGGVLSNKSYHGGILGAVLDEHRRVQAARRGGGSAAPQRARVWFEEDIRAGDTFCFEEVVVAREPNLQHRKLYLQTRSSMSTAGVARGFDSNQAVRSAFRRAVLTHLRVAPPRPRVPTVTYLSRPMSRADAKRHGRAWQLRCHVTMPTFRLLASHIYRATGYEMRRVVFERTTYAYQAKIISETDVFWSAHGAGMVHMPLLPRLAAVVEMFNCGHFSYLYANLALHLGVRYFAMQQLQRYCYEPPSMYGDTRRNMSKTYAFTIEEAEPVLMQAVRYHVWQDPVFLGGPDLTGRESKCELARKSLEASGTLPFGMTVKKWTERCEPMLSGSPVGVRLRRTSNLWLQRRHERAEGDGLPGQYTRWAGVG